jgi:hypothetical protein
MVSCIRVFQAGFNNASVPCSQRDIVSASKSSVLVADEPGGSIETTIISICGAPQRLGGYKQSPAFESRRSWFQERNAAVNNAERTDRRQLENLINSAREKVFMGADLASKSPGACIFKTSGRIKIA